MNLIMLCGQESSGKSTYGIWLEQQLPNCKLIRMNDIAYNYRINNIRCAPSYYIPVYCNAISEAIRKYDYVICDFSQDTINNRRTILNMIKMHDDIDFTTISLRPGLENVLIWHIERTGDMSDKTLDRMIHVYETFEFPSEEEFKNYPFNSIKNIIIDNSKPFNINDLT